MINSIYPTYPNPTIVKFSNSDNFFQVQYQFEFPEHWDVAVYPVGQNITFDFSDALNKDMIGMGRFILGWWMLKSEAEQLHIEYGTYFDGYCGHFNYDFCDMPAEVWGEGDISAIWWDR